MQWTDSWRTPLPITTTTTTTAAAATTTTAVNDDDVSVANVFELFSRQQRSTSLKDILSEPNFEWDYNKFVSNVMAALVLFVYVFV